MGHPPQLSHSSSSTLLRSTKVLRYLSNVSEMKRHGNVCLLCEQLTARPSIRARRINSRWLTANDPATRAVSSPQTSRHITLRAQLESREQGGNIVPQDLQNVSPSKSGLPPKRQKVSAKESSEALQRAKELGTAILSNRDTVPKDEDVLEAMKACEYAAGQLTSYDISTDSTDPASALLLLSGRRSDHARPSHPASLAIGIDLLSNLAHKTVLYPTVFITQEVLHSYVITQSLLQRPDSFPEIFKLYATKPKPKAGTSSPIEFSAVNPQAHTAAIPADTANLALEAAIKAKNMELCLEIINTTFRTRAWQRNKFLTKAAVPLAGVGLAPFGAYVLASQFAMFPSAADPTSMTLVAFGGGLTYLSVVASMGFIALTTANDQMQRVTWATGTPLRERWIREEERAAMDKVVLGFGFSQAQKSRWGDESGPEWEYLREWIGERGLITDRVELMEGME